MIGRLVNVWASWLRVVPHWLTSLTEPAMALRSVTLWAKERARAFAACCCAAGGRRAAERRCWPSPRRYPRPRRGRAWAEGPAAARSEPCPPPGRRAMA